MGVEIDYTSNILDYDDERFIHIAWSEIFSQNQETYCTYIYSQSCGYCQQLKQDVLSYALSVDNFYFLEYSDDVILTNNIEKTIGIQKIDQLAILGTPTILEIKNKVLTKNIAGKKKISEYLSI